jgi:hypothetical protein
MVSILQLCIASLFSIYIDINRLFSANNHALENKRKTLTGKDVMDALEEMEFPQFVEPLKTSLEGKIIKH